MKTTELNGLTTGTKLNTNEADTILSILGTQGQMANVGVGQSLQPGYDYTNLDSKYDAVVETEFSFGITVEQVQSA